MLSAAALGSCHPSLCVTVVPCQWINPMSPAALHAMIRVVAEASRGGHHGPRQVTGQRLVARHDDDVHAAAQPGTVPVVVCSAAVGAAAAASSVGMSSARGLCSVWLGELCNCAL